MSPRARSTPAVEPALVPGVARRDAGSALVVVLTATMLLSSVGLSLLLLTDLEVSGAGNHRDAVSVSHAADAALDYAVNELATIADWNAVLAGTTHAGLNGPARLPVGAPVDVPALTDTVQHLVYGAIAWGANTPRWRVFAHGPLSVVTGGVVPDVAFVVVWVSDDVAEDDGNHEIDGNGAIVVRARAMGVRGSAADVQAVIARTAAAGVVRRVSWGAGP